MDFILWRPCWSGVDLFFVISGFLISGILFAEFKRSGRIRFGRFAIRRALKIYPSFYVLVLLTVAVRVAQHRYWVFWQALHDLLFIQSYTPGTWGHFWSLSVEEHFYVLLPVLLFFLIRRSKDNCTNPFTAIPKLFLVIGPLELIARLLTAKLVPFSIETNYFPTHLRMDSLFFGVVISYFYHFHEEKFSKVAHRWRYLIFCAAAGFLVPIFVIGQYTAWICTYGLSCIYVGYGLLLVGSLQVSIQALPKAVQLLLRVLARVGTFSYSIYLWHGLCSGMVSAWLPPRIRLSD
jgi:peptidoglycan/LPS O-acetylase OafA/YrhL